MAATIPTAGKNALLEDLLEASTQNLTLKLYSAVSPALGPGTVAGDFTEATFTGYSAKTLTRATWDAASSGSKTYPQQSWSPTSSQTIIGYYVVGATDGIIRWAEAFPSPRSLVNGDTLTLDLTVSI